MDCTAADQCNALGQCEGVVIAGCCVDDSQCDSDPCEREACNLATRRCEADPVICEPIDLCHFSACAEGRMASCLALGLMYAEGRGVEANRGHANALLKKACDHGSPVACRHAEALAAAQ